MGFHYNPHRALAKQGFETAAGDADVETAFKNRITPSASPLCAPCG